MMTEKTMMNPPIINSVVKADCTASPISLPKGRRSASLARCIACKARIGKAILVFSNGLLIVADGACSLNKMPSRTAER
ncbi:Uncharacterised protein [Mycobacterium tuberculosis]|nr:Uncharacterised protein [Mycobacterium tuberculosis]